MTPSSVLSCRAAPVSAEEVQAQEAAGSLDDVTVTPGTCAAAVQSTRTTTDAHDAIAAQVATTDAATATVQRLTEGGPVEGAVDTARDDVAACSEATTSSPGIGTATITSAPLAAVAALVEAAYQHQADTLD